MSIMQAAQPTPTTIPARSVDGKYANDGSLESVKGMLHKQAILFHSRVLKMGLPMEFDDVLGEMHLAYVKARAKWTPEKARFSTYCFTVVRNEFNRRVERMTLDRQHLGMGSIDEYHADQASSDDLGDGYERYLGEEPEQGDACSAIERRQEMRERLAGLSPETRRLLALLVQNETSQGTPEVSLRDLAKHMGLAGDPLLAVQQEISKVFGVAVLLTRKKAVAA